MQSRDKENASLKRQFLDMYFNSGSRKFRVSQVVLLLQQFKFSVSFPAVYFSPSLHTRLTDFILPLFCCEI